MQFFYIISLGYLTIVEAAPTLTICDGPLNQQVSGVGDCVLVGLPTRCDDDDDDDGGDDGLCMHVVLCTTSRVAADRQTDRQ